MKYGCLSFIKKKNHKNVSPVNAAAVAVRHTPAMDQYLVCIEVSYDLTVLCDVVVFRNIFFWINAARIAGGGLVALLEYFTFPSPPPRFFFCSAPSVFQRSLC